MNHVHISFLSFLITMAYMTIGSFFARFIAMKRADSTLGEGLLFLFG